MPYLSQPILACHDLFASPERHYARSQQRKWGDSNGEEETSEPLPFSGPKADYDAHEVEKSNRATILELQSSLNAALLRSFRSPEDIATDLLPYLVRMLTPDVKPVVVGGSGDQRGIASVRKERERDMVRRAVDVMGGVGVIFERGRLESETGVFSKTNQNQTQWVYRMEPALDPLVVFETSLASVSSNAPARYAVRQVLDQEYQKSIVVRDNTARQARYKAGATRPDDDSSYTLLDDKENRRAEERVLDAVKKDFFGRVIREERVLQETDGNSDRANVGNAKKGSDENKVWVSFHEGFSNAVRKPITLVELLRGL